MEQFFIEVGKELARQVPALFVLAAIVYVFLKVGFKLYEKFTEMFNNIHREHLDERANCRLVIRENTDSNKELIEIINTFKHELQNRRNRP